ncbi:TPA: valine--tRNA ligase [Candidatus Dependentiae bacterium]|nr:MAG: Valine-tRNA ligase [candidate division TM6 bacterium GW2011_GWE2_31_21]KKP53003.1 MAG: Valine-tRNA ligase [candidate division TM6 bacterium GW2011_GWF2_33_332]HBS47760.1 valine--tRNA ligase [Candidatus Dependentiae bacterium]HBZ73264.1 valine--tRNA ligase [Candidatus Dependentiae bacterium]
MEKNFDHKIFEPQARKLWEENKINEFDKDSKKELFSIDTPPPTVSGSLHMGHMYSYTQQDLIARYKRMRGFNVFYPMGFDDNGLATEKFVEKKHQIKGKMMKRSDFIELCLKESHEAEKQFEELWKTMGLSIDWNLIYSTISPKSRKISQISFLDLYKKNLVYRKDEPSLYCTTCQTTVAQAELENIDVSSTFNDIEFETETGEKLTISTTRPELLAACVAIFYNPSDSRYSHLKNKYAITPIYNQKVQILPDEKVSVEKGTGLVMCCTFGDQTDIWWQKKYNLPFIQIIGFDGKWTAKSGQLEGLRVHDARKKILELLKESGKLLAQKQITHPVNTHERCKQEIEYLILTQWFIKILDHKQEFIDAANKIEWKPKFMQSRYNDWVENLAWDWCISRQRFYGVPFPVWHCQDCGCTLLAQEKDLPIDPQETTYPAGKCDKCGSTNIKAETDVMDTWATSALTPQLNANWPQNDVGIKMPMSLRPQAHDIIRTWAFYTIVKAHYHNKTLPWTTIALSGYVTADGKEKISKSKGNAKFTPQSMLELYPTDTIRYWSANGRLGCDTILNDTQLKIGNRLVTKLWNAFRFCKEHIANYEKSENIKHGKLNQWLLHKFSQTYAQYIKQFDTYEYTAALQEIETFFWQIFCDNYLELVKDQFFNPDKYSKKEIESTRFALYEVGFGILQLFAPFVPYISESIYQIIYKDKEDHISLHQTKLDAKRFSYEFTNSATIFDELVNIIGQVRKLKSEKALSLKTELKELQIFGSDSKTFDLIKSEENVILGVTNAKQIIYKEEKLEAPSLLQEGETWMAKVCLK